MFFFRFGTHHKPSVSINVYVHVCVYVRVVDSIYNVKESIAAATSAKVHIPDITHTQSLLGNRWCVFVCGVNIIDPFFPTPIIPTNDESVGAVIAVFGEDRWLRSRFDSNFQSKIEYMVFGQIYDGSLRAANVK